MNFIESLKKPRRLFQGVLGFALIWTFSNLTIEHTYAQAPEPHIITLDTPTSPEDESVLDSRELEPGELPSLVRIISSFAGTLGVCSGTIIADHVTLFTLHCDPQTEDLRTEPHTLANPTNITVYYGAPEPQQTVTADATLGLPLRVVSAAAPIGNAPVWVDGGMVLHDGILGLGDIPVTAQPLSEPRQENESFTPEVVVAGFGHTNFPNTQLPSTGHVSTGEITWHEPFSATLEVTPPYASLEVSEESNGSIQQGDSGGPTLSSKNPFTGEAIPQMRNFPLIGINAFFSGRDAGIVDLTDPALHEVLQNLLTMIEEYYAHNQTWKNPTLPPNTLVKIYQESKEITPESIAYSWLVSSSNGSIYNLYLRTRTTDSCLTVEGTELSTQPENHYRSYGDPLTSFVSQALVLAPAEAARIQYLISFTAEEGCDIEQALANEVFADVQVLEVADSSQRKITTAVNEIPIIEAANAKELLPQLTEVTVQTIAGPTINSAKTNFKVDIFPADNTVTVEEIIITQRSSSIDCFEVSQATSPYGNVTIEQTADSIILRIKPNENSSDSGVTSFTVDQLLTLTKPSCLPSTQTTGTTLNFDGEIKVVAHTETDSVSTTKEFQNQEIEIFNPIIIDTTNMHFNQEYPVSIISETQAELTVTRQDTDLLVSGNSFVANEAIALVIDGETYIVTANNLKQVTLILPDYFTESGLEPVYLPLAFQ